MFKVGDEMVVKSLGYDQKGRLNLSRKEALPKSKKEVKEEVKEEKPEKKTKSLFGRKKKNENDYRIAEKIVNLKEHLLKELLLL